MLIRDFGTPERAAKTVRWSTPLVEREALSPQELALANLTRWTCWGSLHRNPNPKLRKGKENDHLDFASSAAPQRGSLRIPQAFDTNKMGTTRFGSRCADIGGWTQVRHGLTRPHGGKEGEQCYTKDDRGAGGVEQPAGESFYGSAQRNARRRERHGPTTMARKERIWEDWESEGGETAGDGQYRGRSQEEGPSEKKARREEEWSRGMARHFTQDEGNSQTQPSPPQKRFWVQVFFEQWFEIQVMTAPPTVMEDNQQWQTERPSGDGHQRGGSSSSHRAANPAGSTGAHNRDKGGQGADPTPAAPAPKGEWWQNQRKEWKWRPKTSTSKTTTRAARPENQEDDYTAYI